MKLARHARGVLKRLIPAELKERTVATLAQREVDNTDCQMSDSAFHTTNILPGLPKAVKKGRDTVLFLCALANLPRHDTTALIANINKLWSHHPRQCRESQMKVNA